MVSPVIAALIRTVDASTFAFLLVVGCSAGLLVFEPTTAGFVAAPLPRLSVVAGVHQLCADGLNKRTLVERIIDV